MIKKIILIIVLALFIGVGIFVGAKEAGRNIFSSFVDTEKPSVEPSTPQVFKYSVNSFTGGINLAGDSTDLAPNEALSLKNFEITQNSAESRHGISVWNTNSIDTNGTSVKIDNIFIYEPYPDTLRLCIAAAGFIYIIPTLDNPAWDTTSFPGDVDSAWGQYRLGFQGDGLKVFYNGGSCVDGGKTFWYTKISMGDRLVVDDDSSSSEYEITNMWTQGDTTIFISPNYKGATDSENKYMVYKKMNRGITAFKQIEQLLYISGLADYTIVYDDTNYQFLALVDSGIVDSANTLEDSVLYYNNGTVFVEWGSNIVKNWEGAQFWPSNNVDSGSIFILKWFRHITPRSPEEGRWASEIIDVDSAQNTLELADILEIVGLQLNGQNYEIVKNLAPCNFDADIEIRDGSKNWFDDQYGNQYLTGLYYVSGLEGATRAKTEFIYCNSDSGLQVDTLNNDNPGTSIGVPDSGDVYYIFSGVPVHGIATLRKNPFFEQLFYKNNQLFGFGAQAPDSAWWSDAKATGFRIWYSEIDIPFLMKSTYFFDLDKTENITVSFELINGTYIATTNSIWRMSGIASTDVQVGNLNVRKIVSNVGIPDIDNWAQATLEYIYFADETGLYFFNGIREKKIGLRVDPLFERYRQSDLVMGYFPIEKRLFISWPDSGVTLIYDENYDAFIGPFDFGMTCMNQQSAELDTTIFFFGHSDTLGHVFFYPNSVYFDSMPGTSVNISYEYLSGHQSYSDYSYPKKPREIALSVQSPGAMEVAFYNDFSSSKADSFVTDSTGNFVYIPSFDRGFVHGEYLQTGITASAGEKVILRGYTTEIQWLLRYTK